MIEIYLNGWEKKPRTKLSSLVVGDVFALAVDRGGYAFGRLVSRIPGGYLVEVFNIVKNAPVIDAAEYVDLKVLIRPMAIDCYGLFDRKIEGDWRVIGRDVGYKYPAPDTCLLKYGAMGDYKYINVLGERVEYLGDPEDVPLMSISGDYHVQEKIRDALSSGKMISLVK